MSIAEMPQDLHSGNDLEVTMRQIGIDARAAFRTLTHATTKQKNTALKGAAEAIRTNESCILKANSLDITFGKQKG